jgi:SAM-dependent methyltransferase
MMRAVDVPAGDAHATDAAERYTREREAHNKIFGEHTRESADKFYSVVRRSRTRARRHSRSARATCARRTPGCGAGSHSKFLARHGAARVVGIDLSDVAIAQARASAVQAGLPRVEHMMMNAEALGFSDNSFDLICGTAILHHLDLARGWAEIARTLRPGGTAAFLEPLGHNPLINLYRRLTPRLRTVDEHPLLMRDLRLARQYFANVRLEYFTLHALLAVPLRQTTVFPRALAALERLDASLFRTVPFVARYAWQVVLVLEQPIKRAIPGSR